METKKCSKCKQELEFSQFRWRNKAKGVLHSQCKNCEKQVDKIRYKNSFTRQNSVLTRAEQQKENNLFIVNTLKAKGCAKCGEKRLYLMDFHHVNSEDKVNTIAHMTKSASKETLLNELDKCIILCSNCHREFHYFEKEYDMNIDEYLDNVNR